LKAEEKYEKLTAEQSFMKSDTDFHYEYLKI
jgi:hypothetical protein